tara:strand:+ start:74 stop:190 length:117 start_codon:yes stop_codon:yes gene_type:complete
MSQELATEKREILAVMKKKGKYFYITSVRGIKKRVSFC